MENSNDSRKNEILAKVRQSNKDEGMDNAKSKGSRLGEYVSSLVIGLPIIIFSLLTGEIVTLMAIGAITFAYVFGQSLTVYLFSKSKSNLAWTVFSVVMTIYFVVEFIAASQGWWISQGWQWWQL